MGVNSVASGRKSIRWMIFLPPWILVVSLLILNMINVEVFMNVVNAANGWILKNFAWMFNSVSCASVLVVIAAYFSPFGNVRFGGSKTRPIMPYSNYVWVILCTIMAAGILLWACAEPMYHLYSPPKNITAGPKSVDAIIWAMQIIIMEWTFTPMAIYSVPALVFAFVFYNMHKSFSVGSILYPALGDEWTDKLKPVADCICLFALVAGMSASLGSGVFLLAGGLESLSGGAIVSKAGTWIVVAAVIVIAFVISAASGVMRGIRLLSMINSRIYIAMGLFVFLFGPTAYLLDLLVESTGLYLNDFFKISLWTSTTSGDGWSQWWPSFYWCNWMAWMPITSVFLGRLSRGYSVKEAIRVIFFIPAVFSLVWLVLFTGTAINFELAGLGINAAMKSGGTEAATYAVFRSLPLPQLTIPFFLLIVFVSFVTAADSNTNAMSGICTEGLTGEDTESPLFMKIVWGFTIGGMCIIMITNFGINGLKMASNLGGFPAAFLLLGFMVSLIKLMRNPAKYDTYKEDYDENGKPIPSVRLVYEGADNYEKKGLLYTLLFK